MRSTTGTARSSSSRRDLRRRQRPPRGGEIAEEAGEESRPPSVTVRAVTGLPAEELLNEAAHADMIVVGSRGAGGFKRLLMGSVSTQVTHHAHCPVVVIPDDKI
jgi:nucleotide-binding universal stress UspA family protein